MRYCDKCHQPLPIKRGRICADCGRPIKRHDRYHFEGSQVKHNDCERPSYTPQLPWQMTIDSEIN
jgi:predicted amidophosphoribosyltransferase